ncbi:PH domain-containing protein [Microbacterium sp. SL75]|uniref:PH domain-containing protein n=1 Tax=Microbacterium sp. SL75 TaxID=2995140 RepID=UPI00226F840C|nr:PH domain-containing protein [Microbacterium sp. SL75]WAC68916.1 PH domain-containing protein [Microbacterium sp. SL75]
MSDTTTPKPGKHDHLRADIRDAAQSLPASGFVKRDLAHLESNLAEGETVSLILSGTYDNQNGILALTDRRLLFLNHGLLSQRSEDFPLEKVSSVQFKAGMVLGEVTIYTSNQQATIKNVGKPQGKAFVDASRARLGKSPSPASSESAADSSDPVAQLTKLAALRDASLITPDEYNAKKAEILERM